MTAIRNIAIIAHVDHGKTTLVDKILHHCALFRDNQETGDLILDNNDLERERGITILSKNVSVNYKGTKINIIDTPGHADFGGEVERVLNMADGVLLLVDAFEGPMPQTRFVLQKAIEMKLKPIVVINKVDKENCTPEEVHEAVFDLMFELGAEDWQLDFPTVYGSAKQNWMSEDWRKPTTSIEPLLDMVVEHIPAPVIEEGSLQMLITSLDYSTFTGRIAIGRLHRGTLKAGMNISLVKRDGSIVKADLSSRPFHVEDERGNQIEADTLIIATGASAKYLGLPDEEKYRGQGVSSCAICDGFFYRKRTVAVVGGGDTACEQAMYLSGLAKKVYMIVRKPQLRAAEIMRKRVTEKENIEILYNTNTVGLFGDDGVQGAHLVRFKGEPNEEKFDIAIDGLFLAIGHTPNTDLFKGQLEMDDHGFIVTGPKSTATNIEGVYAAGDVADPTYKQGVVAAATGAMAAMEVDRFLQRQ